MTRKRRWGSTIANWELAAGRGDDNLLGTMEADLAAETSGNAILMVNSLIGQRSEDPRDPEAFQVVSLNWIAILAKDPAHTKFLVLHAIGHPVEAVRIAAAEELRKRPREDYVPLLLSCARFPVEFACSLLATGGLVNVHSTLDIQGLGADTQIDHSDSLNISADFYAPEMFRSHHIVDYAVGNPNEDFDLRGPPRLQHPARTAYPMWFAAAALGRSRDMRSLVDQYNAASVEINQRVAEALARATGEDLEANPRTWQTWWNEYLVDYYELESSRADAGSSNRGQVVHNGGDYHQTGGPPQERPVYRYSSSSDQYAFSPAPDPNDSTYTYVPAWVKSCFSGSTPVWTITGLRPIEELRPGDRVLSQNVSSGELAYKVVRAVTQRDPTTMIRITVGGEEIVSTLGHPFWVVGQRWIMAKHLRQGSLLHTVSGPRTIEKVEEIPAATEWYEFSYNLEVDGFHTYFVGETQVLVHHLSMLSILDEGSSQVPGL